MHSEGCDTDSFGTVFLDFLLRISTEIAGESFKNLFVILMGRGFEEMFKFVICLEI